MGKINYSWNLSFFLFHIAESGKKLDPVPDHTPVPVTPTELAELRAHLATVVAMDTSSSCSASPNCSSYFIEPVEWMETLLLGHVEGKVVCMKMLYDLLIVKTCIPGVFLLDILTLEGYSY
jgi:hypothetical protein